MEYQNLYLQNIIDITIVSLSYFMLVIALTSFMIKPIIKTRGTIERFLMYVVIGNLNVMAVTYILAYLNIFNRIIIIIAYILTAIIIRIVLDRKTFLINVKKIIYVLENVLNEQYGFKLFFVRFIKTTKNSIKQTLKRLFYKKKPEWIIFIVISLYNLYIFNSNNINFFSFAFSDEEVHLFWIQSLISGDIFPSGVYPHLLHTVIASISVIFKINAAIIISIFGITSTMLIFTMLYLGLRKTFSSKYIVILVFVAFNVLGIFADSVIRRYQSSLPQEYGMIFLIPMILFLYSFIKNNKFIDLVLFGMCLCLIISSHFYTAIIALILCLSYGLIHITKIFKKKIFVKLIICGITSLIVAMVPLALGVIFGKGIEQSMEWAMSIIDPSITVTNEFNEAAEVVIYEFDINFIIDEMFNIYNAYFIRYNIVMYIYFALLSFSTLWVILSMPIRKLREKYINFMPIVLFFVFLTFLIISRFFNLPQIMYPDRALMFVFYFTPFLMAIPFEIIYKLSNNIIYKLFVNTLVIMMIPIAFYTTVYYDIYRMYPDSMYFQTKGAMLTNRHIIENYNGDTWTIVSPINDMSVIMNDGYHYEIYEFIDKQENWNEDTEVIIPSKYIFIYIEKLPVVNKFIIEHYDYSKAQEMLLDRDSVSHEYAKTELKMKNPAIDAYIDHREVIMSKAYYWAKEYIKYFPKEMTVYYEDEEIIIYRIIQDEYSLNNFAIDYGYNTYN